MQQPCWIRARYRQHRGGAESNLTQAVEQSAETGENTDTAAVQSMEEDVTDAEEPAAAYSELQTEEEQQETSEEETTEEAAGEETEAADDVPEEEETEDPVSESSTEQKENGDVSEEAAKNSSEESALQQETEAGWITNENGSYSYQDENGNLLTECVAEIDGKYYGFDSDGRLYMNERFTMDVEEDDEYVTKIFWASEDGSLYTDCWKEGYYIDGRQQQYYMGSDGACYTGIHTMDGKQYYFYDSGLL